MKKLAVLIALLFLVVLLLSATSVLAGKMKTKALGINPYDGQSTFFYGTDLFFNIEDYEDAAAIQDYCYRIWDPTGDEPGMINILGGFRGPFQAYTNHEEYEKGLVTINEYGETWEGYTLLNSGGNGIAFTDPDTGEEVAYNAALVDMEGNLVHGWNTVNGVPMKMFKGGYIMGGTGGAQFGAAAVEVQDWCGNELWRWDGVVPEIGARQHHDHQKEGNPVGYYVPGMKADPYGRALILSGHDPETEEDGETACPDTSHISNYGLIDDAIYEVDADGNVIWSWFACEHFEQMGFTDVAKEGIMNMNVGRGGDTDWTHFNNVNYLGPNKWWKKYKDWRFHPENIIFDSRTSGMIGIIARVDHPKGDFVKDDIVWRVGPDYMTGPEFRLGQIIGPHAAHMIPKNLPGAGNIIVFDNGGWSTYGSPAKGCMWELEDGTITKGMWPSLLRDYSRVIEFNPITMDIVWEYKQPYHREPGEEGDRKFFSTFISNQQRLPNGNNLICEGNLGRIFEVTKEGKIVWEYIAPARAGGPGVIGLAVYRAYRIPYSLHSAPKSGAL
jgi:hypothetical protein